MKIKTLRGWHRKLSIYFGIIIFFYAISGILLNHRTIISSITINRNWLPSNFHLHNWNQASIRGKINITAKQRLIFGNIGVYQTDQDYSYFRSFNQGLPLGIDLKKSFDLLKTDNGTLFLATESGLFVYNSKQWQQIFPQIAHRIYSLAQINNRLFFMDRSHLYSFALNDNYQQQTIKLHTHQLIPPKTFKNTLSLFRTLWFIHSGEIFGLWGKLAVDFLALLMVLLIGTGFFFIFYKWIKKKKLFNFNATQTKVTLRSLHLQLGSFLTFFLIISALSGTFLRPPFLILINDIEIAKVPWTHFYNNNPWFEKLRGFFYDQQKKQFFIFTGRGDIYTTKDLDTPLQKITIKPPISIMGINHFSKLDNHYYLVGSFSGLFAWDPTTHAIFNYFTRKPYHPPSHLAPPVSDHLVSGVIKEPTQFYIFDYSQGSNNFPAMPTKIKSAYPMSLWNLALEIHTGRLFSQYLGPLFLLYVPLSGIALVLILLAGLWLWFRAYRR